jgi:chromosome segregation ATPase
MTVEERLARLEGIIEAQTEVIGKLSDSITELNNKLEARLLQNGKQDVSIASIQTKQEKHEKEIEALSSEIHSMSKEFQNNLTKLTSKVYWLIGVVAGLQAMLNYLLK